jgi:LPXTG-site transpeptidase (sortase) family protein
LTEAAGGSASQRTSLRWLQRIPVILGFLLIGQWFENGSQARAVRSNESMKLEAARLRAELGKSPAGIPAKESWRPITLESGVFGRIEIPRLGISALIAEGTTASQLDRTVGHITATAFPGQPGNCGLAGNRDGFLRGLREVCENDVIHIDTLQGTYTYEVVWSTDELLWSTLAESLRVDVLDATPTPSLTLVTFREVGSAPERFVVRARLVSPAPVSGGLEDHDALPSDGVTAERR